MNIESWCTVERNRNQEWTRTERKHADSAFQSSVFDQTEIEEGRVDWSMSFKPDRSKLAKRRHFQQKCELS